MATTPLQGVYTNVQTSILVIFVIVGMICAGGLSFMLLGSLKSQAWKWASITFILVLGFSIFLGNSVGQNKAEDAVTNEWNQAKNDQATYLEVLHGPFFQAGEDSIQCVDDVSYSTCKYEWVESRDMGKTCSPPDSDGKRSCHEVYQDFYHPWFKFERNLWAGIGIDPKYAEPPLQVNPAWPNPRIYFASNLGPENCADSSTWMSTRSYRPGSGAQCANPADYIRIVNGIKNNQPVVGSMPHHYLNYIHAADQTLFTVYGGNVASYLKRGILPTMNNIYSRSGDQPGYDYSFVQFLDGVVPAEPINDWQNAAAQWAAEAGPKLQASLILYFAPVGAIPNRQEWINTSKAYLMDKSVFGRRILPKNLVMIGCAVNSDKTSLAWCEMETGMFTGNNAVKDIIQQQQNIPFSIAGIFGKQSAVYKPNDNGTQNFVFIHGQGLLELLYAPAPNGFKRVSMGPNDYLMTNVTPTDAQIADIIGSERLSVWWMVLGELVLAGLVGYAVVQSSNG